MDIRTAVLCVCAAVILTAAPASAGLIYSNDFHRGAANDFKGAKNTATSPDGEHTFLGVLAQGDNAKLKLSDVAPHNFVTVEFDLIALRSLDGPGSAYGPDYFEFELNGVQLVKDTFLWSDSTAQSSLVSADSDAFGWGNFCGGAATYHLVFTVPDSSKDLLLSFIGDTKQPRPYKWLDEGYGIDNLKVYIDGAPATTLNASATGHSGPTAVPEPPAALLLALALLLAGLISLRMRSAGKTG